MRARFLLLACAGLMLAACASVPGEPVVTQAVAAEPDPVDVAAPVSDKLSEGMTVNEWGGEVPQSQPAGEVGEDGLGDLD